MKKVYKNTKVLLFPLLLLSLLVSLFIACYEPDFSPMKRHLTIEVEGDGEVDFNDEGVIPAGSTHNVFQGQNVVIRAIPPENGGQFLCWELDEGSDAHIMDIESAVTTIRLNKDDAVLTAHFCPRKFKLSLSADECGNVDPLGDVLVSYNEPIAISASSPDAQCTFVYWAVLSGTGVFLGDANSAETTVRLTKEDATLRAIFTLTLSPAPTLILPPDPTPTLTPTPPPIITTTPTLTPILPPEITVIYNNQSIPNGTNINRGDLPFDLNGSTKSRDFIFTIRNDGSGDLRLGNITINNEADFQLVNPPSGVTIPPNGSTSLIVRLAPLNCGGKTVRVTIPNNDTDEDPFIINLQATVFLLTRGTITLTYTGSILSWNPASAIRCLYTGSLVSPLLSADITVIGAGGSGGQCEDVEPNDYYDLCGGDGEVVRQSNINLSTNVSYEIIVGGPGWYTSSSFIGGGINIVARAGETPGIIIDPPGLCRDGRGYPNNTAFGQGACGLDQDYSPKPGGSGAVIIRYSAYVSCECE